MSADAFAPALEFVLRREGGYVNDPRDPGGETKYGISRRSYPGLDIANLTLEQAGRIYRRDYWDRPGLELLPPPLAAATLDAAVNLGPAAAIKLLQQGLNNAAHCGLHVDGVLGPATSAAAGALNETDLRLAVKETLLVRAAYYARLAASGSMLAYLRGWILRTTALSDYLDNEFFMPGPGGEKKARPETNPAGR